MAVGGALLKGTSVFLRFLQFLASIAVLGIFAYFLVFLRNHALSTYTWVRAVEGISGASALYTVIAFFLVCCIGGVTFFALLGVLLDIAFIGGWIAVAVLTRHGGTANCGRIRRVGVSNGDVNINYSITGFSYGGASNPNDLHRICVLEKSSFGIAIAAAILFILSALFQHLLGKHHQREKRKTPNTPVMASQKRKFWQRKNKQHAAENGQMRYSQDTAMTGATATEGTQYGYANSNANTAYGQPKYGQATNY